MRRSWMVVAASVAAAIVIVTVVGIVRAGQPRPTATASPGSTLATPSGEAAGPPTACEVGRLPVPDRYAGQDSEVTGGDPSGRYLVGRATADGGAIQPLLWTAGGVTEVAIPGNQPMLTGVRADGTAVGHGDTAEGDVSWIYRDGVLTRLPGAGWAEAVNDAGVIVGSMGIIRQPSIWRSATVEPEPLPIDQGWMGEAVAVTDDGTVIGNLERYADPGVRQAVVWVRDTPARELPRPDVGGRRMDSSIVISTRGDFAVGAVWASPEWYKPHWVLWNLRTGTATLFTDLFDIGFKINSSVNRSGWLAGMDGRGHLVILAGGVTVDLPSLTGSLREKRSVSFLSDDGQVAAGLHDIGEFGDQSVAVVWRCHA